MKDRAEAQQTRPRFDLHPPPGSPSPRSGRLTPVQHHLVRLTVDFDLGATYGSPDRIPASGSRLGSPDELRAILSGRACPARRRLDVLHAFTEEVVGTRGRPSSASIRSFLMGGFTHAHVMEVMRAVALRRTSATTTGPRGRSLVQQVGWADGVETEAGP